MRMSISAAVIAAIFCAAAQPAGAVVVVSSLYLTAGDQQNGWIVQGSGVVGSWKATNQFEYPIAVNTTVRTLGRHSGEMGHEYTLSGTPTGPGYAFPIPGDAYDGTTDGIHNYLSRFGGGGTVYQTDATWSSAVPLFSLGGAARLGITYDPLNNSLWLSGWGSNSIENRALDGTLLSSFSIATSSPAALALDPADDTLWLFDRNTISNPVFYQYSKAGSLLGSLVIPALAGQNILGGEFAHVEPPVTTPEPASVIVWSLLGLSLAGTHLWRRRRTWRSA